MDSHEIVALLRQHFPAFQEPRPLALDTRKHTAAMAAAIGIAGRDIRRAVRTWTLRTAYLRALAVPGAVRYRLDGEPGDPVSPEHRAHAAAELERRKGRRNRTPPPDPEPVPEPPPAPVPPPIAAINPNAEKPVLRLKRKTMP